MDLMRISNRLFSGERPKIEARYLQDSEAQLALDCELTSTGLRALNANRFIQKFNSEPKTIYSFDDEWLTWDKRVCVAESPTGVTTRRVFWTGDGAPKQATIQEFRKGRETLIGIPTPIAPSFVSLDGDAVEPTSNIITTLYTVSFVNRYGEEGDMSLPSPLIRFRLGRTLTIGNLGNVSGNQTKLRKYDSIVAYRLYRLDNEQARFVTEQPLGANTFADLTTNTLGEIFQTQDFVPPPDDMQGLHVMANGVGVGFVGKNVYMSEPYQLNVWPYNFPVRSAVVAISSFDNTLVIATQGYPEVATVYDPRNVTPAMLTEREPCVSPHSMVQGLGGVIYATPSNLFYIGPSGGRSLTEDFMGDRHWAELKPETSHAVYRDGTYYAFHEGASEGGCWVFDTRESNAVVRRLTQYADAAFVLQGTDDMYLASASQLELFQGGTERLSYRWIGKEHGFGNPVAMTCARALSESFLDQRSIEQIEQSVEAQRAAQERTRRNIAARRNLSLVNGIGGAINQDVIAGAGFWSLPGITDPATRRQPLGAAIGNGSDQPVPDTLQRLTLNLRVFADTVVIDESVIEDEEPIRLSYADRARRWSYELSGEMDVSQFDMAGSQSEMHYGS